MNNRVTTTGIAGAALVAIGSGLAPRVEAGLGQPTPGQWWMQEPATPVAEAIVWFHDWWVNPMIVAIGVFVMLLMLYVMYRFAEKRNPVPTQTTHNTALEVAWTVIPILILIAIGIPSFKLLFLQYSYPKPDLVIKATANAWFWEHQYPDQGGFTVTSNMIRDSDLLKQDRGEEAFRKEFDGIGEETLAGRKAFFEAAAPLWTKYKMIRQLSVNNEIAVPVNKVVQLLVTSNDVIHAWTIPSFGSKLDAVPGRVGATWFKPTKIGVYYGQCSVLCGKEHSAMPITVRVVSEQAFADWTLAAKARDWKKARGILQAATEVAEPNRLAEAPADSVAPATK